MLLLRIMSHVTLICLGFVIAPALGITGFRNDNPVDVRRQVPFSQESQVPDLQQNRFSPIPAASGFRQTQNEFVQQSSVEINPVQFTNNPQQFVAPQQYHPVSQQSSRALPEPIVFDTNNQQFIDSNNNQFLPHPTLQTGINYRQTIQELQDNYFQQNPISNIQQTNQLSLQVPSHSLNVQLPSQSPTSHSFLPTIPTDSNSFQQNSQIIPTNNPDSPYVNILTSNPIFSNTQTTQLRNLLEEQRKQDLERLKELQERQKIIQKHKQFLERQQQKQQQKVQKLHEEFLVKQKKKQEEIYATTRPILEVTSINPITGREVYPHELSLFEKAIKQQESLKITTTTPEPTTTRKNNSRNRTRQRSKTKTDSETSDSYQSNKQKSYKQTKSSSNEDNDESSNKLQYIGRQDLLKQLKLALVENSNDINLKNFSSREIALPSGEKFEVIRTSDPNLIAGATPLSDGSSLSQLISQNQLVRKSVKAPKLSFEDLTKGVLPPGADFEVIKQTGNGNLEEIGKIPSDLPEQKKVTFVFIEEQNDGSYKVKGVRGNDDSKNVPNLEVENVIQKIKEGQIKFPGKLADVASSTRAPHSSTREAAHITRSGSTYAKSTPRKPSSNSYQNFEATKITSTTPKYYNSPSPASLSINHNGSPSPVSSDIYDSSTNYGLTTPSTTMLYYKSTHDDKLPDATPSYDAFSTMINGHQMHSTRYDSSSISPHNNFDMTIQYSQTPDLAAATSSSFTKEDLSLITGSSTYFPSTIVSRSTTTKPSLEEASSQIAYTSSAHPGLIEILKENGLFAAAKYIKQSGLDTILNETGPYTVFAPTDKAFRTLLIQLGGPDKAEEKFKENPRLLSGLLLHHIIPGAFEISSLQDEMTGVSLAGTQLRVNQYDMHDVEWNEIKVTTINGARVLNEKQDIRIPQGIAHAIDRVMFPLPVGDIVQTLQADRERRFSNFLKALFNSGMVEALSDSRTYTVFAPVDKTFSSLSSEELQQLVADKERSKELVTRHIAPGTLFSAGMRYYQIRDTMAQEKPITLQKNAGRIKVNSGHVITHNIPATNGVIHAVDMLL